MVRIKVYILLAFCFSLVLQASAQQVFTLHGVVSKKLSSERIAQVLVSNLRSQDMMISDELGWFSIKVAIGDTLLFKKIDYTDQKVVITTTADIPVYMQPVIMLQTVTVKGQTTRQEIGEVMRDYRKQGTFYDGKPPVLSFLTNPVTAVYELFGATPGRARRFAAYSKAEIEAAEISKRYNLAVVKRVTKAPDSLAKKFMQYYTPALEDLKGWNDYELIQEIKRSYDFYEKDPNRKTLEDLNSPLFIKPQN